jgi:erythromycin esterase
MADSPHLPVLQKLSSNIHPKRSRPKLEDTEQSAALPDREWPEINMKQLLLTVAIRLALSGTLLSLSAGAHGEEDGFGTWATAHAVPIATLDAAGDDSDLLPIQSAIGAARVVAIGEPLHGAHEPLAFRNRLFRFLVQRMGFTAIAVESGFTDLIGEIAFIETSPNQAHEPPPSEFGAYLENRELVQWMHDYNTTATSGGHRKIHLYGMNLPSDARPSGPRQVLNHALDFIAIVDPASAQTIRASLSDSLPSNDVGGFRALPPKAQSEFEAGIHAIAQSMHKNRNLLISRSSDGEYQRALHNLDTARQLAKCLPLTPQPSAGPGPWVVAFECRDSAMAKNVQWALQQEGREGRLLVFAHNAHVMSWREEGPRWASAPNRPAMMGLRLRQVYGNQLYIIAMSSATTDGGLPKPKPIDADSVDRALTDVALPLMFLDIRDARQNPVALRWVSTQHSLNANVYIDFRLTPSTTVDAFSFVKTLTPAMQTANREP